MLVQPRHLSPNGRGSECTGPPAPNETPAQRGVSPMTGPEREPARPVVCTPPQMHRPAPSNLCGRTERILHGQATGGQVEGARQAAPPFSLSSSKRWTDDREWPRHRPVVPPDPDRRPSTDIGPLSRVSGSSALVAPSAPAVWVGATRRDVARVRWASRQLAAPGPLRATFR